MTFHHFLRSTTICAGIVVLLSSSAALQQKGGEEETGPYEVVANWPHPWARTGYIWGSQPGIFAESPNRIFIAARGELKLPETLPRGFNGIWGSLGERATAPKAEMRNCLVVVDKTGTVVEAWTQWDKLFEGGGGPHKIKISPYDPQKHVWVVNDSRHVIYEFTNDGKQLVLTLGETDVPGDDGKHFGSPQDLTFLPDGSILVADGLRNTRVARFDRTGTFVSQWGTRGNGPGQFSGLHGIDADGHGRVYVADRGNNRIQVFDEKGTHLDTWPNIRFPNHVVATNDGVFVADGDNARLLKYNTNGELQYFWGTYGTYAGAFWELHQFSVDAEGTLYAADSFGGRVQKFTPRPGADKTRLVPASASLASSSTR
ncbi:MAG: 6-bladed beta-propeller [Acidobacteriaceae bacterium]|jgi:sugar lactone lactonase YvrE|nr:6-bladed beta-propeller [Acidobacteriaceae bacterium]